MDKRLTLETIWLSHQEFSWVEVNTRCEDGTNHVQVTAKDVTLNLGKESKVPEGKWGKIVHDKNSMWIASWMDMP